MAKFDPHYHKKHYLTWKNKGCLLPGLGLQTADLIRNYLDDMELGANISPTSKKGARTYGRLRNVKAKLHTMFLLMQEQLNIKEVTELEFREQDVLRFFNMMREGKLHCRRITFKPLKAVGTYARTFKAFWNWYQRVNKKAGKEIRDVTGDLDGRDEKPKFNYFTFDDLKKLCNAAIHDYKVLMMFMYDSGIRSPTELMNVRPLDLDWNEAQKYYVLNIREETSKTFGRRIKLLLCSEVLHDYLAMKKLAPEAFIFKKTPQKVNQYLTRLGYKVLKIGQLEPRTYEGRKYLAYVDGLTMYDFRHSSACYWLPIYKSESALKYRFGWKKSDMIHYYTDLLGMRDTLKEEDMYLDITKTELEKQILSKGKELEIVKEKMAEQDKQMKEIIGILKALQIEELIKQKIVIPNPSQP